jgi:glycine cleavage system transcriptional repressor
MHKVVISVLGLDRPGLLAAVSEALLAHDCNIENVSQTLLQSIFGAILLVSKPAALADKALEDALRTAVAPLALDVSVKRFDVVPAAGAAQDTQPFVITTIGPDSKGLVAGISRVLADRGCNITNLQAVFKGGDDPLNNMMIYEVDVPNAVQLPELLRELETKAEALGLETNIQHRQIFEAINRI